MKKILITECRIHWDLFDEISLKNFKVISIDNLKTKNFFAQYQKNKNFKFYKCDISNIANSKYWKRKSRYSCSFSRDSRRSCI